MQYGEWANVVILFRDLVNRLHDAEMITDGCHTSLTIRHIPDIEALDHACTDLYNAVVNRKRYELLERMERGQQLIAQEKDPVRKAGYEKFMKKLASELEGER